MSTAAIRTRPGAAHTGYLVLVPTAEEGRDGDLGVVLLQGSSDGAQLVGIVGNKKGALDGQPLVDQQSGQGSGLGQGEIKLFAAARAPDRQRSGHGSGAGRRGRRVDGASFYTYSYTHYSYSMPLVN